ncbi:MAG TPA: Fic family protein [Pseudobdellovibrionaceae bacterium]
MYKHLISNKLLKNIKSISIKISELEKRNFSEPVLAKYELSANLLSAYSSTSIEGNPLALTEVKKILKSRPSQVRKSEQEVLNYNDCLVWLNSGIKKNNIHFNYEIVLKIHKIVMKDLISKGSAGKIRNEPVFVNDPKLRKTIYWPPDHQEVPTLLKELFAFVKKNEEEMDPLILAGIFHKQFVVIHPFIDGNGRSVRLATKVLLAKLGINTFNLFSFENYYNRNVSRYFANVGVMGNYYDVVEKLDFTQWLEYFSDGILDELSRVQKDLENEIKTPTDLITSHQELILNYIRKYGFIRDKDYAKLTDRAKATRTLDFKKLIEQGYIERHGKGPTVFYKFK